MTKTVAERVIENVESTLRGIRVTAGYRFDAVVEEATATTNTARGDAFLMVSANDPALTDDGPINFDEYDIGFSVAYKRVASETTVARSPAGLRAEMFGEIVRALMTDEQRGGLAVRTFDLSADKDLNGGDGSVSGEVTFTVRIRTVQDDPFRSAFEA